MSTRVPFVAGNWKMNTTVAEGVELARGVAAACGDAGINVAVLPPFTHLVSVAEMLRGTSIQLGAQNVYWAEKGAFTGEISLAMLADLCSIILVGHSERRHLFGDTDEHVARRLAVVLGGGLRAILAVGETQTERDAGDKEAVLERQLASAFAVVDNDAVRRLDVAYEPVWAIGTGDTASPADAQASCAQIRKHLDDRFGSDASGVRLLYGGSMTAGNAAALLEMPDIDGGLIGGASLKLDEFSAIVAAARKRADSMA